MTMTSGFFAGMPYSGGMLTPQLQAQILGAPVGVAAPQSVQAPAQQGLIPAQPLPIGGDQISPDLASTSGFNLGSMNAQTQGLMSGFQVQNGFSGDGEGNGAGGQGTADDPLGSLALTGNASDPYAAFTGDINGNMNYQIGNGDPSGKSQTIQYDPTTGKSNITAPVQNGDNGWGKFLTVAGIGALPIAGMLSAAGEFGGLGAAGLDTSAADASLDQIGNSGLDSVYGTSAPGGLADSTGAGIPSGLGDGAGAAAAQQPNLGWGDDSNPLDQRLASGDLPQLSDINTPGTGGLTTSQYQQLAKAAMQLMGAGGATGSASGSGGLGGLNLGGLGGGMSQGASRGILTPAFVKNGILGVPGQQIDPLRMTSKWA